jgi:1,4-alpha-glucan branching enzyme
MSLKKQYLKDNKVCKVTFSVKKDVENVSVVRIPGEFNGWDIECEPMKKLKSGVFTQTLSLPAGQSYQYKLLVNDSEWRNDPEADSQVPNNTGPEQTNSVVEV